MKDQTLPPVSVWCFGGWTARVDGRNIAVAAVLFSILVILASFSITIGKFPITMSQLLNILLTDTPYTVEERVVFDIRLPRILTAICVGAALGVSGAIFQSVSSNPLGSPDIIGFTSGAATGALLQIIVFRGTAVQISIAAIAGGLVTALVVYLLARKSGRVSRYRLILTGIGIGAILSAFNGLLLVKGELDDALTAGLWLSGSLHSRNWSHVMPVLLALLVGIPLAKGLARSLMMTEMGEDMARQLGVRVEATQLSMMVIGVILAALATGAAGPIAFVALVAPQLVRRLRVSAALPIFSSALMGAGLLLSADLLTKLMPMQLVLPIGRVTGILGGLYLLWLLRQKST